MLEKINKELVPIKAHYFLYNAATGPIIPFLPVIAKQLGFSGFLVGIIYTILPISGLLAKPLFCSIAEKFNLHKIFFLTFQAILAISFFSIYFIPKINHQSIGNVTLACHAETYLHICPYNTSDRFSDEALNQASVSNTTHSSCKLACQGSSEAFSELCHGWQLNQFCGLVNANMEPDTKFEFTAGFNIDDNQNIMSCLHVKIKNATFDDDKPVHPFCDVKDKPMYTQCMANCTDVPEMKKIFNELNGKDTHLTTNYQFHLFLWSCVVSWIGMAVVTSIADSICNDILGNERINEFGKQKLWGYIGFGIFCISTGYLVDLFSRGIPDKDYSCIFYIMLVGMIFDIIVSGTLDKKSVDRTDDDPSVLWELGAVAREGRVLVFIFWCVGAGICTGVVWNFLFWYTEDIATNKDWLKTLQGLLIGVQYFLGELPFNFISARVLKKLGHINVMSLVLIIYAVRFMAYSLITNPWIYILVELLHGPTLGLCRPTMIAYGDKIAPSGTRATMQGLVGAIFEGIGVSIGSLICGRLMDDYSGMLTFRIFSVGALSWLSIYWMLQLLLRKAKAYPLHQGHSHLASYATPSDAILMTTSQELQTY
ncbi:GSCOCG00007011001-RA-CDS [Cotesia congregata]|uniref:Similar to MFSD6: Major facilitator superfamily domain-containing protein 6 (Sus scrofa) n=1 Tax=Cotesia congregata TaxID=51543 RepID=A0A8J2H7V8_COTCN|nr:GSCOCG00007011001-RA-CDS [Cotesia congregata]CAG5082370.1 Similar to MFSD6: Major facilitator superfamily domain-containing protein 6 (Sus scrofa) [Cotesia congregata]